MHPRGAGPINNMKIRTDATTEMTAHLQLPCMVTRHPFPVHPDKTFRSGEYTVWAEVNRVFKQWIAQEKLKALYSIPIEKPDNIFALVWCNIDGATFP